MATKPPPKPPGGKQASDRKATWTSLKDMGTYQMPMRSEYEPEWRARLREAGYPTDVVVLDFENYFDDELNMRKISTIEYIMDPRFENLCLSVLEMRQPFADYEQQTHSWVGEDGVREVLSHLQREYGENLERCTVVAQNARYDGAILSFRFGIHPPHFIDELGLARHWNSRTKNDLDSLTKRYELPEKGDTSEFKEATFKRRFKRKKGRGRGPKMPVMLPVLDDEKLGRLIDYANNDVMREWELFTILLPKLSDPSEELRVMQHTLELFWKPCLKVDYAKGEELKAKMDAAIDEAIEDVANRITTEQITRKKISGDTSFERILAEALRNAGDNDANYRKPAKNKKGWKLAIAKDDPEREQLETHSDDIVKSLMTARSAVKSWPLHIKRIDRIMAQAKAGGGYLPVPLKYCGAHTGRWSGGEKINLQNLGSRGHELVNAVREMLIAPEGHELVIADASQIEARVLAWFAGQDDLLQKFENDEEIYCGFASRVVGWHVRKPKKGGIKAIEDRYKWARNSVGKVGVLGCGYGMGAAKAQGYAGGEIDFETAERVVKLYRQENDKIVNFWHDIERAFIYTAKYKRPCKMSKLEFHTADDCDVIITLPKGRELKYHKVQIKPGKFDQPSIRLWNNQEKKWAHVWGGHLCLAGGTPVLTDRGWVPIESVRLSDRIWDGTEWVCHGGRVFNGLKDTIQINGIGMTHGHKILTDDGWQKAGAACGLNWKNFRLPDGCWAFPLGRSKVVLESPVSVREKVGSFRKGHNSQKRHTGVSILFSERETHDPRHDRPPGILGLAEYAGSVSASDPSGMAQLWRSWNWGLRTVEQIVREFLGRYGADLQTGAIVGSDRQRRKLLSGKLPVGDSEGTGKQQAVYDIQNCGPRNQFVIKDGDGYARIVHNCENVVQALSRDILWGAIHRVEKKGYHTALHVHDEMVVCVKQGLGDKVLDLCVEELSRRPAWAADCPLAAEGVVTQRYGEH